MSEEATTQGLQEVVGDMTLEELHIALNIHNSDPYRAFKRERREILEGAIASRRSCLSEKSMEKLIESVRHRKEEEHGRIYGRADESRSEGGGS